MDIKKSFFGGYKRSVVEQLVGRLTDIGNVAEAKGRILEKEIDDLKHSTKADIELLSQDAESGRRKITDLKAQLELAGRQAEELRRQLAGKDAQIARLEEKCRQADRSAEAYDVKIREIGEIYIEAQEYTKRLKEETKKEVAEIVNTFFDQMLRSGRSVQPKTEEIENCRGTLNEIAEGLEETSAFLKNRLDRLDTGIRHKPPTSGSLDSARDRLVGKVQSGYGQDILRGTTAAAGTAEAFVSPPLKSNTPADPGSALHRPGDPSDAETSVMPGQLELIAKDDEEEDRHKYQQTFDEMGSIRSSEAASGSAAAQSPGSESMNPADRNAAGGEEAPATPPKKTSIREILEKYSKF